MTLRASTVASTQSYNTTPTLKQYKLESIDQTLSDDSEIEVVVDSVYVPDTEDLCCQMLLNKYAKQRFFLMWKLKLAQSAKPVFDKDEFESLKEQSNRNASSQQRHRRHRFLSQYANLARLSLDKFVLSRLFSRWCSRFERSRLIKIQDEFADGFSERKIKERGLHGMRTAFMHLTADNYDEASKNASQVQQTNKVRELLEELDRTTKKNQELENDIQSKSDHLQTLQQQLRQLTSEDADAEKKLQQVQNQTQQIQASLVATEQKYQQEVAQLKTELSLAESGTSEELDKIYKELQQQQADRQATTAFVESAQAHAQAELEQYQDKLRQAESVVRSFKDLLQTAEDRTMKLRKSKEILSAELENLRIKKHQLEASQTSTKGRAQDKEDSLKRLIQDAHQELQIALNKYDAQNQDIASQRDEIKMLQEEIQRCKDRASQARARFMASQRNY